jgi:hypothetical protein
VERWRRDGRGGEGEGEAEKKKKKRKREFVGGRQTSQ